MVALEALLLLVSLATLVLRQWLSWFFNCKGATKPAQCQCQSRPKPKQTWESWKEMGDTVSVSPLSFPEGPEVYLSREGNCYHQRRMCQYIRNRPVKAYRPCAICSLKKAHWLAGTSNSLVSCFRKRFYSCSLRGLLTRELKFGLDLLLPHGNWQVARRRSRLGQPREADSQQKKSSRTWGVALTFNAGCISVFVAGKPRNLYHIYIYITLYFHWLGQNKYMQGCGLVFQSRKEQLQKQTVK